MWIITIDNKVIASSNTNIRDFIDIKMSAFRGPNYILWHNYLMRKDTALSMGLGNRIVIYFPDGDGRIAYTVEIVLEAVNWDKDHFVYRFTPYNFYMLNSTIMVSDKYTLKEFIEKLDIKGDVIISSSINVDVFDRIQSVGNMTVLDYIANICSANLAEFFITDNAIVLGPSDTEQVYYEYDNYVNSTIRIIRETTRYTTLVCNIHASPIGTKITYDGVPLRVLYFHSIIDTNTVTTEMICAEIDLYTTEQLFLAVLPLDDSYRLLQRSLNTDGMLFGKISKKDIVNLDIDTRSSDKFQDVYSVDMSYEQGSPYLGDKVGVQYPINIDGYGIMSSVNNDPSFLVEVSQVIGDNTSPTRNSENDYRLTFPSGGTIYYNTDDGILTLNPAKEMKIGIENGIAYDEIPNITDKSISIDADGIEIKYGNSIITIKNDEIELTNGSVSAKLSGGTMDVS